MKAAVLRAYGEPLSTEDVTAGDLGDHSVRVRVVASGVCHSDLHAAIGDVPFPLPTVLGHEGAGIVEAVGARVTEVAVGDHVVGCMSLFCGTCTYCLTGRPSLCSRDGVVARGAEGPALRQGDEILTAFCDLGCFAEEMVVHERALAKIPPEMPLERAALLGCAVTTGLGAVFNTAGVRPGDTVAVVGCGGVGLAAIQAAAIAGADRIIAVDRVASKAALVESLGATDFVHAGAGDVAAEVVELTGGGVDHAIEAAGSKATMESAFRMLRPGGTATVCGLIGFGQKIEIDALDLLFEKRIQGSQMGSNRFRLDIPRYARQYLAGRLDLDSMVSRTISLDQINDAFAAMGTGELARQVILL
ncbi:MAG: S-(hydroxymethyl)glutathione dehydrogenase / alcohol dehydrogenase [Actinomycetota bacterium]|nr:S-(hydroxymethyl)glutathione dehydrogenase / alcohol dehydrogenase [Actinomycetota bacterium]